MAVVLSGGKQYRVEAGDRILVDRLAAEPGAEIALDRVLLLAAEGEVKVGSPLLEGVSLLGRVIGHQRGPKIDVLRYKSKKRVRVHRGSRAELTAIEVVGLAGAERPRGSKAEASARASATPRAARRSGRPEKAAPETPKAAPQEPAAKTPRRRRAQAAGEPEAEDGA